MSAEPPTSTPPPGASPLWGGYDGKGGAPVPTRATAGAGSPPSGIGKLFGDEPLEPLSQRLLRLAGLLAVLLLLVLVNHFLNGGEDGSSTAALAADPVATAAERLEGDMGGRMSLYVVYSSPALPGPLVASGSGAYNGKTRRTRIVLNVNNPLTGQPMQSIQIIDGEVEYDGGDMVAEDLPPGKKWVRTEKGEGEDQSDFSFEESMEMLSTSNGTKLVSRESINGKMTRRYRGEIKLSDVVDHLREKGKNEEADAYEQIQGVAPTQIRAEGWVDGKNLLRRMRMVMPMPGDAGEPPMTIDMRMDFFAFGAEPKIEVPAPATVVDGPIEDDESAPAPASVN